MLLVSAFAAVLAAPAVVPTLSAPVDLSPAIKIGDFVVSRYLFEKAYRLFIASAYRRTGQEPGREEVEHWFRVYLSQQVIKADLMVQKQLDRPEVVDVTTRMARYMLTQSNGPLYRELGATDRIAFRRERRAQILQECRFSVFPENVTRLWTAIAPALSRGEMLCEADVAPLGASMVARYVFNGVAKQISALDFVRDFQRGIARMAPRDPRGLGEQIEDIVVAEYDWTEAKRRGVDQTPQFLQDRENFALNQALALYEQEVLSPRVTPSSAELTKYYRAKIRSYVSPVEISGVLQVFADRESARRGLSRASSGTEPGSPPGLLKVLDPFVIRRDGPPLSAEVSYAFLASVPTGRNCGPFVREGKYVVFGKRATGELEPLSFDQVQDQVRRELARQKIEALELECLSRNLDCVQLTLDLAAYKIDNPLSRAPIQTAAPHPLGVAGVGVKDPAVN